PRRCLSHRRQESARQQMWNWFVSRVLQTETKGLKYFMQMQRISRAERNYLVKVARWNVECFIVGQRPGSYKVAFIAQQICDLSTDRRGRAKREPHSQPGVAKEW